MGVYPKTGVSEFLQRATVISAKAYYLFSNGTKSSPAEQEVVYSLTSLPHRLEKDQ